MSNIKDAKGLFDCAQYCSCSYPIMFKNDHLFESVVASRDMIVIIQSQFALFVAVG